MTTATIINMSIQALLNEVLESNLSNSAKILIIQKFKSDSELELLCEESSKLQPMPNLKPSLNQDIGSLKNFPLMQSEKDWSEKEKKLDHVLL